MVLKLVKDTKDKVKSVKGSSRGGKVASYLSIGASIAEKVGYCAPAVGMVGGAMKMASNILDPPCEAESSQGGTPEIGEYVGRLV